MENGELIAILREVRERVRARNPETGPANLALPDLMPLVHARDAAMGKVAAIGTVNPRSGGPLNALVQGWKRLVARVLDWHVREQVEFNRKTVAYADAVIEALRETNRSIEEVASRVAAQQELGHAVRTEMTDIRNHWLDWRPEWERKLQENEVKFLRNVSELEAASEYRMTLMDANYHKMESNYRDALRSYSETFREAIDARGVEIQKRLWEDMARVRVEFERMIHQELRLIRQRAKAREGASTGNEGASAEGRGAEAPRGLKPALQFDYRRFAERFRGSEEYVKKGQEFYLPYFVGCKAVLDIGCGRGEFLEMMRGAGVSAKGIDLSEESVAQCKEKRLDAETADAFAYLDSLGEGALDGIFCSQVIEHVPPERLPELIKLCCRCLTRDGVIAFETPNPECLAIFATHFYLDPTHERPIPAPLMIFYLEEFGVGGIEVHRLTPAIDSMPSLESLPDDFRAAFFGALDYAVIGHKL